MGVRSVLLIAAVLLFVLGAFKVALGSVNLLYLGLACFAAAFLVGEGFVTRRR
ncbi:MAG: hypothetical protein NVSMB57_05530 [Actinomycetota bacterium]